MQSRFSLARGAFYLQLYNAVICLIWPGILVKKALRFRKFHENYEWDRSRWSIPAPTQLPVLEGKSRIVLLALGWAEVQIIDSLSRKLEARQPHLVIIWMVRDAQAREMAKKAFPSREIVPMPFDFSLPTKRFLDQYRPDALIVVEKFWWPNLLWGFKKFGAKIILVNGRSRGRQKLRYKIMTGFQKWILGAFDLLLFESEVQVDRVRDVLPSGTRVKGTGNIKWSFESPKAPPQSAAIGSWMEDRKAGANGPLPLLFAGSTSHPDDIWVLEAWRKIRERTPCTLAIAPRKPERGPEIAAWLLEQGYESSLRSSPRSGCEILVLDTFGELSYAYQFAVAAYVGGAISGRGHNIIEPLLWGIPVAYGPNRGDFESVQKAAEEWEVGFRLQNADDLARFWSRSLDPHFSSQMRVRIESLLKTQRQALDLTIDAIAEMPFMNERPVSR
jgi:3-deoxy-D-manno-octulosonic-acid transferase